MPTIPELVPVESSNVTAIGYDEARQELYVTFNHSKDTAYVYALVPLEKYKGLMEAESKGKYLRIQIISTHTHHTTTIPPAPAEEPAVEPEQAPEVEPPDIEIIVRGKEGEVCQDRISEISKRIGGLFPPEVTIVAKIQILE